ncbi:MAG TPA: hypothetical protein VF069_05210 [Streptosporangiaceae bacterium]
MDDETTPRSAADRRYARLVRLAYLVLPAVGRRRYRLAIAQRIVDTSLERGGGRGARPGDHAYAPIRSQVLRQAMYPRRRLWIGLNRWLRGLPDGAPAMPARLAALDPAVRAAYVLRRVESLPRSIVRDELAAAGVPDAAWVVAAAAEVPELALPRVMPGPPVHRRSPIPVPVPIAVAGVLTLAAVVAAQSGPLADRSRPAERSRSAEHPPAPRRPIAGRNSATPPLVTARPAADAGPRITTVQFWSGRLPGGAYARWTCRRTAAPGRPTRADGTLIVGARRLATGDCGRVPGATVGGTWWYASGGRWYYVAAASPHFAVRVVAPASFPYPVPGAREGMLAVPGPRAAARPGTPMTVTARRVRAAG